MTEFWKSNPNFWCELCRCWMADSKAARTNHDRGMGHQENLKKKLRDMGRKADSDKREAAATEVALGTMEKAAAKRYAKDVAEQRAAYGTWEWDEGASYYYNAVQRWYFDPKTSWYYGGEPTAWAQAPAGMAAEAKFGVAEHHGGPIPEGEAGGAPAAPAAVASTSGVHPTTKVQRVVHVPSHPMLACGGHAMPSAGGRIGAGKGVGMQGQDDGGGGGGGGGGSGAPAAAAAAKGGAVAGAKRGREGKAVSAEEAEALARREAAKARVAGRTLTAYGLN